MEMGRKGGSRTKIWGSFGLSILKTVQPNDFDTCISEDPASLAFSPSDSSGGNRGGVKY